MVKVLDRPGAARLVQELERRQWRAIRSKVEVQGVLTAWFHRRAAVPRSHAVGSGAGLTLVPASTSANLPRSHLPCVRPSALVPAVHHPNVDRIDFLDKLLSDRNPWQSLRITLHPNQFSNALTRTRTGI